MENRAQKLWDRGISHFRQGNLEAAQANFEAFLVREPTLAGPARFRLSMIHARRGRFRAAIELADEALQSDPSQVELLTHLARCCLMDGEPERARSLATRALALPKSSPVVFDSLGVVMTRLDESVLALELFNHAIALEPGQASMYFNRALANKQFGFSAAADADLETCLALNPGHAKAHWTLATLRSQNPAHNHKARLGERLAGSAMSPADEELISLALFKELDDLDEFASAEIALHRGIASRRYRTRPAAQRTRENVDALTAICNARYLRPTRSVPDGPSPVFVFGMPRSGVALMGGLLSRHSKVHHLGFQQAFLRLLLRQVGREAMTDVDAPLLRQFAAVDFEAVGRQYLAAVTPPAGDQLMLCESQPMNVLLAGFIARAFPGARMLHMSRDPIDNCVAILGHAGGEPSLPSDEPAALAGACLDYQRLAQHWHKVLPQRIMDVRYESLVQRPEMVVRVVCAFLGLRYASSLRTGLQLHDLRIGRGGRYASNLPGLLERLANGSSNPSRI